MDCIRNCSECKALCEGYGCYDELSVAEASSVSALQGRIDNLLWEAHLAEQAQSHTPDEMDEEFYAPIRELQEVKHQLEAFLGFL